MEDAGVGFGQRRRGRLGVGDGIRLAGTIRCVERCPRGLRWGTHMRVDVRRNRVGCAAVSLRALPELGVEQAEEERFAGDAAEASAGERGLGVGQVAHAEAGEQAK